MPPQPQSKFKDDMGLFSTELGPATSTGALFEDDMGILSEEPEIKPQKPFLEDDMGILGDVTPTAPATVTPEFEKGVWPAAKHAAKETGKEALRAVGQVFGAPGRLMTMTSKAIPYLTMIVAGQLDKMTWGPEWEALEKAGFIKPPTDSTKMKKWAQNALEGLNEIQDRLTFTDEPYTDIGLSMAIGGGAAAGTRKLLERTAPMAALARKAGTIESLAVTGAKGGVAAATGDVLIVDPAIEHLYPRIDQSEMSPRAKTLLKNTLPLLIGVVSGFTLEYRIDKLLKNPIVTAQLDEMVKKGAIADDIKDRFFKAQEEAAPGPEAVDRPLTGAPERYRAGEEKPMPEIRFLEDEMPGPAAVMPEKFDPKIHALVKNEAGEWTAVLKEEAPHVAKFKDDMGILEPEVAPGAVSKAEPIPEAGVKGAVESLQNEILSDVMATGNLRRGLDYYEAKYKDFSDEELKRFLDWTQTQDPYIAKRLGSNVDAEIRGRRPKKAVKPEPIPEVPPGESYPAVRMKDGTIITDKEGAIHAEIITKNNLEAADVESGGWVTEKGYTTSPSDALAIAERAQAKQRVDARRAARHEKPEPKKAVKPEPREAIFELPHAEKTVSGFHVRDEIPNTESISASMDTWEELSGIRSLKMEDFGIENRTFRNADDMAKSRELAKTIKNNKEINPLIVGIEAEGPYILEGLHRFEALRQLGVESFPALVVVNKSGPKSVDLTKQSLIFDIQKDVWKIADKKPAPKKAVKAKPKVVVPNKTERDSLSYLAEDLRHGQGPVTTMKEPDAGTGAGRVYGRLPSVNPEWFQDLIARKIIRGKNEVFNIIDKVLEGKRLTARQSKIRDYLYDAADKEWEKFLSPEHLAIKQEKGWTGLYSMAPGSVAGLEVDKEGVVSFDPKRAILGMTAGLIGLRLTRIYAGKKAKEFPTAVRKFAAIFDKKTRFEIDDSGADFTKRIKPDSLGIVDVPSNLGAVLDHPELYRQYPNLRGVLTTIMIDPKMQNPRGSFTPFFSREGEGLFDLDPEIKVFARTMKQAKNILLHEIQHQVQETEGFAPGGSPSIIYRSVHQKRLRLHELEQEPEYKTVLKEIDDELYRLIFANEYTVKSTDKIFKAHGKKYPPLMEARALIQDLNKYKAGGPEEWYRRMPGEIEARDVSARMDMTEAERARGVYTSEKIQPRFLDKSVYIDLNVHPSTITGPIGGIAYGVDWREIERTGEVRIDPKKVLIGLAGGVIAGRLMTRKPHIFNKIATKWDEGFAAPFLTRARAWANGLIVNEDIRTSLGLGRSQQFKDYLRNYHRNIETSFKAAAKLGQELAEIAPTAVEQRRLMQIIRGGITGSPAMKEKARKVKAIFDELRGELKEHNLIQYSRFDKLTRAERSEIRRLISGPNPFATDNPQALEEYAKWFDIDAKEILKRTGDQKAVQREIATAIEFHRSRLNDYYHYGSAKEYAPIYYTEKEGLTPAQRLVIADEVKALKIKSRRGLPEGVQQLEAQIAGLEAMLGTGREARQALRARRKQLNLSYSHRRMDMPPDMQKAMGMIEEAPFPVAKMAAVQRGDVYKAKLYEYVAGNFDWTIWPKGKKDVIPANYTKISGDEYGALDGKYVRDDIWNDLREVEEWRGAFVRNWDKVQGLWKYGKVVLNPATHARNTMSNFILAYFGGVNPTDLITYGKAMKALKAGESNRYYKDAEGEGLYLNTFVSAEIVKLRDELAELRDPKALKTWFRKIASLPSDAYQGNEKLFKTAVFIKARENGMSVYDAARHAEKHLFNYGDLPPFAKSIKRWVSPFFTFTYKALPIFAETAIRKPHKVAAIMAMMYGMDKYARGKLGLSDEEAEINRERMPDWQAKKLFEKFGPRAQVLMPFRDKWGNMVTWDLSYILPFGNISEEWGQSSIPLSDLLPSSPLFNILATIQTNRKGFSGMPVYDEDLDSGPRILKSYIDMIWKEAVPSLAPGGYGFNSLKTGIQNTFFGKDVRDWADRPIELQTAILKSLLGIKLTPVNEQKLLENELRTRNRIRSAVSRRKRGEKRKYKRNVITMEQLKEEIRKLNQLQKKKLKQRPR